MNDDASLHQEVNQGREAGYLLENPVFQQTFDYLKDTVHGHIKTYVDTGKLAKKQLEDIGVKNERNG